MDDPQRLERHVSKILDDRLQNSQSPLKDCVLVATILEFLDQEWI